MQSTDLSCSACARMLTVIVTLHAAPIHELNPGIGLIISNTALIGHVASLHSR